MVLGTQDKSCVIVGRGPSLNGLGLGRMIDKFDIVVRLSNGLYGRDHGMKADVVLTIPTEICKLAGLTFGELWLYDIPGKREIADYRIFDDLIGECVHGKPKITHILSFLHPWVGLYLKTAKPMNWKNHPHVLWPSKGTAAALAAKVILKPGKIKLLGMDNVIKGERINHCHDWSAERAVLEEAGIL